VEFAIKLLDVDKTIVRSALDHELTQVFARHRARKSEPCCARHRRDEGPSCPTASSTHRGLYLSGRVHRDCAKGQREYIIELKRRCGELGVRPFHMGCPRSAPYMAIRAARRKMAPIPSTVACQRRNATDCGVGADKKVRKHARQSSPRLAIFHKNPAGEEERPRA
jgi:hypothetical protein